jgi:hypothetical protein
LIRAEGEKAMMNKESREKMFGLMMDMCCKGISEDERQKMKGHMESCCSAMANVMPHIKDMFKGMHEGAAGCCGKMDFAAIMKHCPCCASPDSTKA